MTENEIRVRENLVRLADGDLERAIDIAAMAFVEQWENTSAGFVRERPGRLFPRLVKSQSEPVLIDGE